MRYKGYEIVHCHPELNLQIVDLMQYLWGNNWEINQSYFNWKYLDNPCTEQPLGIASLDKGKVVGFRGYFATKWRLGNRNNVITILCPGDTCVHPDHRQKGLSVAMGRLAAEAYASRFTAFLNLSSTKNSVPGYTSLGFVPLQNKRYLTRCNFRGLVKHILTMKQHHPLQKGFLSFGQFGSVIVSDHPRPQEMSAINSCCCIDGKITPLQDEDFFKWRYNNCRNKYVFYYFQKDSITTDYIVMGVSPNNKRGYILDYGENDHSGFAHILRYIIEKRHFDIVSIYNFSVDGSLIPVLKELDFKATSLIQTLEKAVYGEWPLLIRPIREDYQEKDWFINGIDIRKIDNWYIKAIYSDAV